MRLVDQSARLPEIRELRDDVVRWMIEGYYGQSTAQDRLIQ